MQYMSDLAFLELVEAFILGAHIVGYTLRQDLRILRMLRLTRPRPTILMPEKLGPYVKPEIPTDIPGTVQV